MVDPPPPRRAAGWPQGCAATGCLAGNLLTVYGYNFNPLLPRNNVLTVTATASAVGPTPSCAVVNASSDTLVCVVDASPLGSPPPPSERPHPSLNLFEPAFTSVGFAPPPRNHRPRGDRNSSSGLA